MLRYCTLKCGRFGLAENAIFDDFISVNVKLAAVTKYLKLT
jgi:hypothetical protein